MIHYNFIIYKNYSRFKDDILQLGEIYSQFKEIPFMIYVCDTVEQVEQIRKLDDEYILFLDEEQLKLEELQYAIKKSFWTIVYSKEKLSFSAVYSPYIDFNLIDNEKVLFQAVIVLYGRIATDFLDDKTKFNTLAKKYFPTYQGPKQGITVTEYFQQLLDN
jgi:hypothetical protein